MNKIFFMAAISTLCSHAAYAQPYPAKPVKLMVGFAAGGAADVTARVLAPRLAEAFGQQFVIENRGGSGGLLATDAVSKSPADGYTLLLMPAADTIQPAMRRKLPYDLERDFVPVTRIVFGPWFMIVHPSVPAKNLKEFIAIARASPGKLNYASSGVGSSAQMVAELLNSLGGIKLTHVPYKGAAPGMTGVMAGEADLMFNGLPSALPFIKAGRLRALAVGGARRTPLLPALPTVAESGISFDYSGWFAVVAPARTAPTVATRLHDALAKILARADMKDQLSEQGIEPIGSTPAQFAVFLREENSRLEKVVVAAGLRQNK